MIDLILFSFVSGFISLIIAVYLYYFVKGHSEGTAKMKEVAEAIREGANAFMKRQYATLTIFVGIIAIFIGYFLNVDIGIAYVVGTVCSAFAGIFGMDVALKSNVRTAQAARKGLDKAFPVAFFGGAVMGLAVVGLALIGVSGLLWFYNDPEIILGFSFGASSIALFAKVGGGIYTKTADIGADLVGKIEMGLDEDDPRNPAVVADNVGDNVGDVAGMGADLFDSYVASIVAAMILGSVVLGEIGILLPVVISALGVFASILGIFFVKYADKKNPGAALNRGTYITVLLISIFSYLAITYLGLEINLFYATLSGLVAGLVIGVSTDFYTSIDRSPSQMTAKSSKGGAAINILTGFSYGLISIIPPILGIAGAMALSHYFYGLYGVALAAVGMLSVTGMIVSTDAYGPISDNAKGIAEQSGLSKRVISIADKLDAAGNTTKAITKGFSIAAAGLTVIAVLAAYNEIVGISTIDLMNPLVMVGAIIGASIPPLFSALTILGVGRNAYRMVEEIRRQFKEIKGLIKGKTKPDYAACVDIATKGALRELLLPSILAITAPLIIGFVLGPGALAGFLAGSILSGLVFALFMANAGGLWDNAKKYIENGHYGGKGSDAHTAAVIGDTVGDPFKDTAGPSINTLLVVMSLISSLFAKLIMTYALFG